MASSSELQSIFEEIAQAEATSVEALVEEALVRLLHNRGRTYQGIPPEPIDLDRACLTLCQAGIGFVTHHIEGGHVELSVRQAATLARMGHHAFWAHEYGVSEDRFQQWIDFQYQSVVPQCAGVTEGERCKRKADLFPGGPEIFEAQAPFFCTKHVTKDVKERLKAAKKRRRF